jgi:hypothetical protein
MNCTRLSRGVAGAAALLLFTSAVNAQVAGSRHDLSTDGGSQTNEVCVYCHTPHGADLNAVVPLWNKTLPTSTYQRYSDLNTSTLDGTEASVGSVSLACLSCHDGSQAMDSVINAPGRGLNSGAIGNVGQMTGSPVPMLGTDLRDDHPISIQYGGGGPTAADGDGVYSGALGDPDFNPPTKATINTNPAWWVDSEAVPDGQRQRTDMILYTRSDAPAGAGNARQPFVECGSCHDPHNQSTFNGTAPNLSVGFLRIPNTNSDICTACHLK